jgi:hypothetical protein
LNTAQLIVLWYAGLLIIGILVYQGFEAFGASTNFLIAAIVVLAALLLYSLTPHPRARKKWVLIAVSGPFALAALMAGSWYGFTSWMGPQLGVESHLIQAACDSFHSRNENNSTTRKSDKELRGINGPVKKIVVQKGKVEHRFDEWFEGALLFDETTSYDHKGSITEWTNYDSDGKLRNNWVYIFDSNSNRPHKMAIYNADGSIRETASITYDGKGNKQEINFFLKDGSIGTRVIRVDNKQGSPLCLAIYSGDHYKKIIYSYEAGEVLHETEYDDKGTLMSKTVYGRDIKGNRIEEAKYNSDGTVESKTAYSYGKSDAHGNWIKRTESVLVSELGKSAFQISQISYRTITYYSDNP